MEHRFFDWDKDKIFCWERNCHIVLVDALVRGIEAGDEISMPTLIEIEPKVYMPSYSIEIEEEGDKFKDGGNHRLLARYIANSPFTFKVVPYQSEGWEFESRLEDDFGDEMQLFPVEEVKLIDYRDFYGSFYGFGMERSFENRTYNNAYPRLDWESWELEMPDDCY
ncbi:hypothetical protein HN832_04325 [archaeon]|jgi:hypothetical protein|nr:hypothetical protein [archaeon]MBT4373379.1 hypothetical protein [archaeon]MBT4531827.1 hypothetical protein [archaeon]MBT7001494.1 hypothetical protein [archaeon]MBT7282614.1 hypothetical protein [archaeon]